MKRIKEKFDPQESGTNNNIVLAYGSWKETHQMKGLMSSPTTGIKQILKQHFTVITVPEYYTTTTCSHCNQRTMESFISRPRQQKKKRKQRKPPPGAEATATTITTTAVGASTTTTGGGPKWL